MELDVDAETARLLQSHGFDGRAFEALRARLSRGDASEESNRWDGPVEALAPGDVTALPARASREHARLASLGAAAIREGRVGAVVLAGGMATRFGGVVKAAVDALPGRSFLSLKLRELGAAARRAGGTVPVYVMTSFATHDEVTRLAAALSTPEAPVTTFAQAVSLRLAPDGSIFREADGRASPYAPGHGDLPSSLARAGLLDAFLRGGGALLAMSNVDNLAATLDEAVLGAHLDSGRDITCEVTTKESGEKGGAPARAGGRVRILESFRFPADFDQDTIPVFNTNTFVLDAAALDRDFPFSWFAVRKKVDGRDAIQFERLVGELTSFLSTSYLEVPRYGIEGRFQPAKDPDELRRRQPEIAAILEARGALE